ncbi:hypothetical protein K3E25_004515 [Escherichia coli]|uniref:hypothetical protein n=1 Tax=Escherichia coli TaxID=562 RepID=UPI0008FCFB63|nr:hypothetical protein [Escherichia coli]EFW7473809.1 hypothetical protein [Shigella sonnei]EAA5574136.1 hypothetical protein [Escherichia coli]EAB0668870.1 hypothetical protein [Escherichia coli]EEW7009088.1 hypothetical protein [Escherichia coli]EEX8182309.1 hypothetical protein [Escherichia coli]
MKVKQITLLCLCSILSNVCFGSGMSESVAISEAKNQRSEEQKKPEGIITEEYKQELEDFKKLQMDNIRLKLQAENEKLSKQTGINSGSVKLVYIYSTSANHRVAEVLGGGLGLREVRVGDHLYDGYTVQEIGKDYIRSVSDDGKEELLKLLFPGQE